MASLQVRIVLEDLGQFTGRVVQKLAMDITANLIETTPIDTGWARSNWVPNIGEPVTSTTGAPEGVSFASQQAGIAGLASYQVALGAVFITNNVPYIQVLNDGHSKQAPIGFVQLAIDKAVYEDLKGFA